VAEFENMIQEQNLEMNPLSFRIKVLTHPQDKKKYVGFVNTVSTCTLLQQAAVNTVTVATASLSRCK
jgi:hypothetical protein